MGIGSWLYTNSTKNLRVKIVHPGGHAELHDRPVMASEIIRRNPKCCVAHPNVFKQPWAIVQPDTLLMPGEKVYVVPISTVRKLQKQSIKRSISSGLVDQDGPSSKDDDEDVDSETSCCSLEDPDGTCGKSFNGRNESESKRCFGCVFSGSKRKTDISNEGGTMCSSSDNNRRNNGKTEGSPKKLITSLEYWQPSLHSIVEERSIISNAVDEKTIQE